MAVTISSAQILGLHQNRTYDRMAAFEAEMTSRLWWCIYLVDRRVSFHTGRPPLILDGANEARLPIDLCDDLLDERRSKHAMYQETLASIDVETAYSSTPTSIPFLLVMVSSSKIASSVLHSSQPERCLSPKSREWRNLQLEVLVGALKRDLHPNLWYNPQIAFEEQFSDRHWWQIKQSILVHMVCLPLRYYYKANCSDLALRWHHSPSKQIGELGRDCLIEYSERSSERHPLC